MFSRQFQRRYRVDGKLAEGGMGTLFQATDLELARSVAIKTIRPDRIGDSSSLARFLAEAKITARLSHPNIVKVLDQGEDDGLVYIVYEFVVGEDLRQKLRREPAPPPEAFFPIAQGVAQALEHAHAKGVVHRDLKPENVLLGADGRVIVGDFGVARQVGGTTVGTATGVIVGTLNYLSPEASAGKRAGPPADVYALGVVAFEMLAGRLPFEAENAVALLRMHAEQTAPRIVQHRQDVPSELADLIDATLAKDPGTRPVASDWCAVLERTKEAGPAAWQVRENLRQATLFARPAGLQTAPAPRARPLRDASAQAAPKGEQGPEKAGREPARKERAAAPTPVRPADARTATAARPGPGPSAGRNIWLAALLAGGACGLVISVTLVAWLRPAQTSLPEPTPPAVEVPARSGDAPRPTPPPPPVPPRPPRQIESNDAARRLGALRALLTGSDSPVLPPIQEAMRQYTTILGVPFTDQLEGLDNKAHQGEIDRLSKRLKAALAWQPRGGLAPHLESAARLLDDPELPVSEADAFLTAVGPYLDLEGFMIRRGMAQHGTPYHDFLFGAGKFSRKRYVLAERTEADLLATLAGSPSGDRGSAFEHWRRAYEGKDEQFVMQRLDETLVLWFCRAAKGPGRPRVLAQECAARFATTSPAEADRDHFVTRPLQLTLGQDKLGPGGGPVEIWVSRHEFMPHFRLDVSVEDAFTIGFRVPATAVYIAQPGWLVFTAGSPGRFSQTGNLSLHAELHIMPGEDLVPPSVPFEQVSLAALEMMVRLPGASAR